MLTSTGELQFNTARGVPYFQTAFASGKSLPAWAAQAVVALQGVPGVNKVSSFNYYVYGSTLFYRAVIETIYGEGTIDG